MATINEPVSSGSIDLHNGRRGLLIEATEFWRQFIVAAFNPYRPEQHYMRGPGPAWRAKHGVSQAAK